MSGASFWQWSVSLYGRPGVKDICLTLQNEYALDVNLVLYGLWLSVQGQKLDDGGARRAKDISEHFVGGVTGDLRKWRNTEAVKADPDLRKTILKMELSAERTQQMLLAGLTTSDSSKERPELASDIFKRLHRGRAPLPDWRMLRDIALAHDTDTITA